MDVSKIKILQSVGNKSIVVPLGSGWDFENRLNDILKEQDTIIEGVVGKPIDYELQRFAYKPTFEGNTKLTYDFLFRTNILTNLEKTYTTRFTEDEIKYRSKTFSKSFFKMDLYDTMDGDTQKIYLTIILTADRGLPLLKTCTSYFLFPQPASGPSATLTYTDCCGIEVTSNVGNGINVCITNGNSATWTRTDGTEVIINFTQNQSFIDSNFIIFLDALTCNCTNPNINQEDLNRFIIPSISLDYVGNQESYFVYWYEDTTVLNLNKLYMSAKFFDAKQGTYTKFSRVNQSDYGKPYNIPNELFYYELNFDYTNLTYSLVEPGLTTTIYTPTWYEYVNPPIE